MAKPFLDPFLRGAQLEIQSLYYPLGFPLQLKTNSAALQAAAEGIWGGRAQAFATTPLELRAIVEPGERHPGTPVYRGQAHLMTILSDAANFAVCDYTRHFAVCRLNAAASADTAFVSYYFLEALANYSLTQLYLTPIHGACVARGGRGVLLCGPSGAGKTSLAYFCARQGWTYISDNESWLVRSSEPLLVGNPRRLRFREDASRLFPELNGRQAAPHASGKLSIEVAAPDLADVPVAGQCRVERVVFLSRRGFVNEPTRPSRRRLGSGTTSLGIRYMKTGCGKSIDGP